MLDRFQSLFDKLRRPAETSLRSNDAAGDKTAVMQSGAERKAKPALAELRPCRSGATGITFSVDKVERSAKGLPLTTLLENFEIRAGASVLILPEQTSPAVAPEGFFTKQHMQDMLDGHRFLNPLIEAVHLAFSGHRPLVLSPDCIWLTIVQGFGHHVNKYAEDLRGKIEILSILGVVPIGIFVSVSSQAKRWPLMDEGKSTRFLLPDRSTVRIKRNLRY